MSSSSTIIKRVQLDASKGRPPIKYQICIVDEPLFEKAASFMVENFLPNENICAALGISSDEEAVEDMRAIWRECLSEGISLAAFLEDTNGDRGPMISCNVLNLHEGDPSKLSYRSEKVGALIKPLVEVASMVDMQKLYNCTEHVHGIGLSVHSDYAGRGIGTEMLKARSEICRRNKAPVSATAFTAIGSQTAAAKAGFQTLAQLDLTTHKIDGKIVYHNLTTPDCKWMAIKFF